MIKLPAWRDIEDVASWVYAEFDELQSEIERQDAMFWGDHQNHPGISASELFDAIERQAVERAERGVAAPLSELLRPDHPMNSGSFGKWIRDHLSPATWALIADLLTKKFKAKPGRPPMTEDERRASYPIHDAAEEVGIIEAILRRGYPKQNGKQIRDRALFAVGRRHQIETEKLVKYFSRPPTDRRRPRR